MKMLTLNILDEKCESTTTTTTKKGDVTDAPGFEVVVRDSMRLAKTQTAAAMMLALHPSATKSDKVQPAVVSAKMFRNVREFQQLQSGDIDTLRQIMFELYASVDMQAAVELVWYARPLTSRHGRAMAPQLTGKQFLLCLFNTAGAFDRQSARTTTRSSGSGHWYTCVVKLEKSPDSGAVTRCVAVSLHTLPSMERSVRQSTMRYLRDALPRWLSARQVPHSSKIHFSWRDVVVHTQCEKRCGYHTIYHVYHLVREDLKYLKGLCKPSRTAGLEYAEEEITWTQQQLMNLLTKIGEAQEVCIPSELSVATAEVFVIHSVVAGTQRVRYQPPDQR